MTDQPSPVPGRRRPALAAGVWLAALETTVVLGMLVSSGRGRPLLMAAVALRYGFCVGAWGGRPGGVLGLLLWEVGTVLAALRLGGAGGAALAITAAVAAGLLLVGAGSLPSPTLPKR